MAYKTLYRLYRPQTFDEVVGQKYVIQTLKNSIKENHVAHAYLFTGPRGTGKTTIAKLLAKALNCSDENKPCGKCPNCQAIKNGTFPDVIEMDAASNNGVDEVRDLIDKIRYAPIQGKYKVYIIDEVHMMSTSAFNALLKTLEEPPAHVVFILATTDPQKVLPTIVSRCQRFDFTSLSMDDIINHLRFVLNNEGISYDEEVLPLIASLSNGGMRDALGILDQVIAYAGKNIQLHHVEEIYGVVSISEAINFINNVSNQNYQQIINDIKKFDQKGIDIQRFNNDLIDILKDIVIYNKTKNISLMNRLDKFSIDKIEIISSKKALKYIDELVEASSIYRQVKSPIAYFEVTILKMCNIETKDDEVKEIQHVVKEEKVQENKVEIKTEIIEEPIEIIQNESDESANYIEPVKEPIKEEKKTVTHEVNGSVEFSLDEILNILVQANKENKLKMLSKWETLRKYKLQPKYQKAVSLLDGGSPIAVADDGIILSFSSKAQAELVNQIKNQNIIMTFFKEEFLQKEYYFYAVSDDEFKQIKIEFVTRQKTNTLPPPHKICPPNLMVEEKEDEDVLNLKKFFGDDLEVVD